MSQPTRARRVGIVGATTLLGKELATALRERRFPAPPPVLLQSPVAGPSAPQLAEMDDEAAVVEPYSSAALDELDLVWLAGTAADNQRAWSDLAALRHRVIDLSGSLGDEPGAVIVGAGSDAPAHARLRVVAHPATQMLAQLLDRAGKVGELTASAVVLEPASERGWPGIRELEQQA